MKRPTPMRITLAARDVAESLVAWRKLRGLTVQQLAERANVSRGTIARLEHGDIGVSLETFLAVCGTLGVLDLVKEAVDPYETDYGRLRAEEELPKRVRGAR